MANIEAKLEFPNPPLKTQKLFLATQICLRTFAMTATLAAAWIMVTTKQSTVILGIPFDAKYSYSSAFKFLAFAEAVASACCLMSLLLVFLLHFHGSHNPSHYFFLFLHDLFMLCLVLSGTSAATAFGFVGQHGNSHTGWMPICDHFGKFCNRVTKSMALSYMSVIFLLMLTIGSAIKSRQIQV